MHVIICLSTSAASTCTSINFIMAEQLSSAAIQLPRVIVQPLQYITKLMRMQTQ